jgi:hypothetical protein
MGGGTDDNPAHPHPPLHSAPGREGPKESTPDHGHDRSYARIQCIPKRGPLARGDDPRFRDLAASGRAGRRGGVSMMVRRRGGPPRGRAVLGHDDHIRMG